MIIVDLDSGPQLLGGIAKDSCPFPIVTPQLQQPAAVRGVVGMRPQGGDSPVIVPWKRSPGSSQTWRRRETETNGLRHLCMRPLPFSNIMNAIVPFRQLHVDRGEEFPLIQSNGATGEIDHVSVPGLPLLAQLGLIRGRLRRQKQKHQDAALIRRQCCHPVGTKLHQSDSCVSHWLC